MYLRTNLQYWGSETIGLKITQIPLDFVGGKRQDKITTFCVKKFPLTLLIWILRDD